MTTGFSHPRNDPDPTPNAAKSVSEHWEHCAFKRIASFRSGAGFPIHHQGDHKADLPFFKVSDMNLAGNETVMAKHNNSVSHALAQELGATIFPPRTIIFPKVGGALLTNKRRVTTQHCCIDNNLMGCTVHRGNPEFVRLLLESIDLGEITKPGPVPAISESQVENIRVHLPPVDEQAAIVRYLDHTDEIINRYISAKERLIALMREQRQAVIHQAVTRGLDPNVPLKPSGVSWLGDMPRHWESPRLRYMGNAIIGLTYDPQNVTDVGGGTLVFRASNIRDGRITYEDCVYVGSRVPSLLITRPGDILICSRSGSRALIGKNAKIDVNSAGNTFGAFMTVFRSETNDYLHYVFNSNMFEHQSAMFATSTVNQLTLGMINDMKTPFPPPHEQEMIVGYLDQATAKIDQAIIQTKRQIDLTNEYRTRLIADAVTGQIDVRNATVELPGEHL